MHDECGDLHPALAAHRTAREVKPGQSMQQYGDRFRPCVLGRWLAEEVTTPSQRTATRPIREQAEMANAHEAARYHVKQKAPQEFVGGERHDFSAVVVRVVLPAKPDTALAMIDEPIIRQGDAVGVPPQVGEHLLRAGKGSLRIHDPVDAPQATEDAGEGAAIGEFGRATREGQGAGVEGPAEAGEILRAKDGRQRPDGKQERRSPVDPSRAIGGQGAAGDQTVEMQVLREGLAPRVQDRRDANRAAQVTRVAPEGEESVRGRAEEGV